MVVSFYCQLHLIFHNRIQIWHWEEHMSEKKLLYTNSTLLKRMLTVKYRQKATKKRVLCGYHKRHCELIKIIWTNPTFPSLQVQWRTASLVAYPTAKWFLVMADLAVSKEVAYPIAQAPWPTEAFKLIAGLAAKFMSVANTRRSCLYSVFSLPEI